MTKRARILADRKVAAVERALTDTGMLAAAGLAAAVTAGHVMGFLNRRAARGWRMRREDFYGLDGQSGTKNKRSGRVMSALAITRGQPG
jgi:hypothetical protein